MGSLELTKQLLRCGGRRAAARASGHREEHQARELRTNGMWYAGVQEQEVMLHRNPTTSSIQANQSPQLMHDPKPNEVYSNLTEQTSQRAKPPLLLPPPPHHLPPPPPPRPPLHRRRHPPLLLLRSQPQHLPRHQHYWISLIPRCPSSSHA